MEAQVLIVDDDNKIRSIIKDLLDDRSIKSVVASSGLEAIEIINKNSKVVLVLLDIWMEGMDGVETLKKINKLKPSLPVIMISGHANIELAVETMKIGAFDFLEKPFTAERFYQLTDKALQNFNLQAENIKLKENLISTEAPIVGHSSEIKKLLKQISAIAKSDSIVLIEGENGTGKELVAKQIHLLGTRSANNFIEVNCAAIPSELIESELFGYEKGAFTGAMKTTVGKFEMANKGTLFLDEIGDMSLTAQAKVLKAIESQEITRLGNNSVIKIDTRIVAATNKDLKAAVKNGGFREDLYYRLAIIPIKVPSLRERLVDIPLLVEHFVKINNAKQQVGFKKFFNKQAVDYLSSYDWPGNVRELRNLVERLVILSDKNEIDLLDVKEHIMQKTENLSNKNLKDAKDNFEKMHLIEELKKHDWNISATARAINIERSYLHKKINKYKITIPDEN